MPSIGDAHQAGLELGADVGDRRGVEELGLGCRGFEDEDVPGSFRDEHPAVWREGDVPWVLEIVLDDRGVNRLEWPGEDERRRSPR